MKSGFVLAATLQSAIAVLSPCGPDAAGQICLAYHGLDGMILKLEIQGVLPNTTIQDGYKVYEAILNDFYDEMASVTETKHYMVGPGNHEANCDNSGKNTLYNVSICSPGKPNFTGFKNHFRMPIDMSGGTGNFWYSWNNSMVHFIQLNTKTNVGPGFIGPDEIGGFANEGASPVNATINAQATWLEADLASVNREKTPWVVVAGYRLWYVSRKNGPDIICWTCKDVFEPLFIKYNINLVFTGHFHVYERLAPLADSKINPDKLNNPKALWYITNGATGYYDGLRALYEPRQKYSRFGLDTANTTYRWSRLTFHNCSHLTHKFIASNNNSALDTATLFKAWSCGSHLGNGNGNGNAHHNAAATGSATLATPAPSHSLSTTSANVIGPNAVSTLLVLMAGMHLL
ncbi:Phosphodiesterase/alkaline phosphatase D [Metarhizium brunneum]